MITCWVAAALAVIGRIVQVAAIPDLSPNAFWIVLPAFVVLALGNL
jgi:hypothetical protein